MCLIHRYAIAGSVSDWKGAVGAGGELPSSVSIVNPNSSKLSSMKKKIKHAEAAENKVMEKDKEREKARKEAKKNKGRH